MSERVSLRKTNGGGHKQAASPTAAGSLPPSLIAAEAAVQPGPGSAA
jgi:hypothetical protein